MMWSVSVPMLTNGGHNSYVQRPREMGSIGFMIARIDDRSRRVCLKLVQTLLETLEGCKTGDWIPISYIGSRLCLLALSYACWCVLHLHV